VHELRRRVHTGGEPWRPNAILLAAVRLDHVPAGAQPWPSGVPVPDGLEEQVRGGTAQRVRAELRPDPTAYRVAPGHHVAAAWRHLLPHEGATYKA
jgi:hypothetical protein